MNTCFINQHTLIQIKQDFTSFFFKYRLACKKDKEQAQKDFENDMRIRIKGIYNQFHTYDENSRLEIANVIVGQAKAYGLDKQTDNIGKNSFYTLFDGPQKIMELISNAGVMESELDNQPVEDSEILHDREINVDSNIDFLTLSYGISSDVMRYATETTNAHLADCLFLGSSVIDGVSSAGVTNNDVLNANIRAYKEYLFGKIKTYLRSIVGDRANLYNDNVVNVLANDLKLFDQNNTFTGNHETLRPLINEYINGINSDSLSNTFYTMRNSDDGTKRDNAKKKIEAYNAFVFFENFDSYLSSLFGDELRIYNRNTPDVYYQLSEHTSKILTTWREGEDIDVGKEIAKITKFIIETVPRLKWNNDCPKGDFVKFGHFQYIISKIRELVWRPEARAVVFNRDFKLKNQTFIKEIKKTNPELYKAIDGKSLVSLISETKLDPRKKFEILFDLFSNTAFMDPKRDVFFTKYFTLMDKDLIYSFSKGLFSSGSRIKRASDSSSNNDFYGAITQTAESIYSVNYIQLHRNEEGQLQFRPLSDMGEYNIRMRIEETINNANSKNIINWDVFNKKYQFEEIRAKNSDKTFQGVKFIIPNNNIKVSVYTDGKVTYSNLNGTVINIAFTNRNENDILPFIDDVLKQNFKYNPIYKDFCKETMGGALGMYERLVGFASRVLLNQYISSKVIEYGDDKDSPEKQLSSLNWGINSLGKKEKHPVFNHVRQELALVSSKDIYTLKDLAKAKAFSLGMTTSTTIKNAEGNSLSRQTFDRLLSNFNTQWEILEKSKDSTTKHFQLLKNNGLVRGTYFFNELYDGKNNNIKSYPRMSVNELAHSQILYNFIGSLIGDADNKNAECRNGNMYIYPCVMSDRGSFPVIKINNHAEIELMRNGKVIKKARLIDFESGEIQELISQELGNYYLNIYNNIYEDWSKFDNIARTYAKKAGIREDLINFIPKFSDDFIYNFRNVNDWFHENNIDVINFIRSVTSNYNNDNPGDLLKLTDQLHFKYKKKGPRGPEISTNRALIAQLARHLPETEIGLKAAGVLMSEGIKYYNRSEFWHRMKLGMIDSMLSSKFRINTTDKSGSKETPQPELVYLRNNYESWINKSGDMYIAKITVDAIDENGEKIFDKEGNPVRTKIGVTTRVDMQRFLDKYGFKSLEDVNPNDIELNPIVEKYNYIDYLISEEFVNSTVGTFTAFSEKSGRSDDILAQESAHITTANKRYMTYASSMHSFRLNALNGMPQTYRIAVMEEMYDKLPTITGNIFNVDASNAATWVNPFFVYLENNSLPNSTTGITKKPYIHFRDIRTGTGGMIKTASFGLSNNTIRNSFEYRNLMKKMSDFKWRNKDGSIIQDLNLLKDYNGDDIHYNGLYFKENGRYFKIIDIEKDHNFNNVYHRTVVEVDESGQEIGSPEDIEDNKRLIVVDTNYKLWQLFGGHNSMEYDEARKKLVWSEKSITSVVEAMNRIGTRLVDRNNEISTQDDLYQPLKHSDIAYVTTEEAVKYGKGNINSAEKMRADNTDPFDTFVIMMLSGGIQLDKEHQADESELSLPTQVVNACGLLGYTVTQANNLYKALQDITNLETSDHMNALKEVLHLDEIPDAAAREAILENFRSVINKSIVRGIQNGNKESTARTIVSGILSELEGNENYANIMLPLSDNTVQNILVSTVSSALTSLGIKMKMPGLLSVLSPSYGTIKLYADRKLESFNNFDEEIKELQKQKKPIYTRLNQLNALTNNYNKIELGRTYIIRKVDDINNLEIKEDGTIKIINPAEVTSEHRLIQTPEDYENLRDEIKNGYSYVIDITEDLAAGRDLAPYNVRFTAGNNGEIDYFQLWDLDSAKNLFKANKIAEKGNITQEDIENLQNMVFAVTGNRVTLNDARTAIKLIRRRLQQDLANISKNGSNWKEQLNSVADEIRNQIADNRLNPEWFLKYTRFFNIIFGTGDGDVIVRNGERVLLNESNFEDIDRWVQTKLDDNARVYINGKLWDVDKNSVEIKNYECIMNKTFATSFGLDQFADLHEIKNDRYWFVKQQIKNYQTKILNENSYTIEFKRSNGNHVYILHGNMLENSGLRKLNNVMYKNENGRKYRVNSLGKKMYQMLDDAEIYVTADGKNEVIVTNNIGFYANELNYDFIKLSNAIDKTTADVVINGLKNQNGDIAIDGLRQSSNDDAVEYANYLSNEDDEISNDWLKSVIDKNKSYHSIVNDVDINSNKKLSDLEKNNNNYSLQQIFTKGREKHTSFIKSLDIVAARIPAQCMQSFMPMEVVAFDNPDLNNVYVSTYQILLQGSDFDIDTVSLVTYDVDRSGIIRMWSPFASLRNEKSLRASEKIAFPTGKKLNPEVSDKNEDRDNLISFLKKHLHTLNIKYNTSNPQKPEFILRPKRDPSSLENFSVLLEDVKNIKIPKNDKLGNWRSEMMKDKELVALIPEEIKKIFGKKEFRLFLNGIVNMVDKHNTYLNNASYDKKSRIVNNYSVTQIFDIIKDPINLIQAQTSVDDCTGPLKEVANKYNRQKNILRCNGNVFSKYENMFNTLMGKQGVGIFANGSKAFEAISQYCNMVLNYGDMDSQMRLFTEFDKDNEESPGTWLAYDDSFYPLFANVKTKDLRTIKSDHILKALAKMTQDIDAAIQLSAMMSLAVDNAKELDLFKLNAGEKTMGMFTYGLSLGMDFDTIAKLMTSRTGEILLQTAADNMFTDDGGFLGIRETVQYFMNGLQRKNLKKFEFKTEKGKTVVDMFITKISALLEENDVSVNKKNGIPECLRKFISHYSRIDDQINELEKLKGTGKSKISQVYNQLIDHIEEYFIQQDTILRDNTNGIYLEDFLTLANGAQEMRTLGNILRANKGVETSLIDLIRQIDNIERAVYDITKEQSDIIDFQRFCFDDDYRLSAIKKYNSVKSAVNVLDVISNVPHFFGYLQVIALADQELKQSFKYRSIRQLYPALKKYNNVISDKDSKKLIRGIQDYLSDYLINNWMQEILPEIVIPKGSVIFGKNGHKQIAEEDTPISLGTDWGNASFKAFVEQNVIPNLKNGILNDNNRKQLTNTLSDNAFVKNLDYISSTRTVGKNETAYYTTQINMLPRDDTERSLLEIMRMHFNKLNGVEYTYDSGAKMKIVDMLELYTMISNGWKLTESSLVPIFENYQNRGLLKSLHDYIAEIDASDLTIDIGTEPPEDIFPFIAQVANIRSSYQRYIYVLDRADNIMKLRKRTVDENKNVELQDFGDDDQQYLQDAMADQETEGMSNNYASKYLTMDPIENINYFPKAYVFDSRTHVHRFSQEETDEKGRTVQKQHVIEVVYEHEKTGEKYILDNGTAINEKGHKIKELKIDGKTYDIPELKYLPLVKVYEEKVIREGENERAEKTRDIAVGIDVEAIEFLAKLKLSDCI